MIDEEVFLALSCELTGFARFDLEATGLAGRYHEVVAASIGPSTLERLGDAWRPIADVRPERRPPMIEERIMAIPALALAAQRIIALWYVGSWYSIPPAVSQVVSAEAYVQGLMWKAIGSHPMAAKPQGYAAWTLPPPAAPEEMR